MNSIIRRMMKKHLDKIEDEIIKRQIMPDDNDNIIFKKIDKMNKKETYELGQLVGVYRFLKSSLI